MREMPFGNKLNSSSFAMLSMTYDGTNLFGYVNGQKVCSVAATGTSSYGVNCFILGGYLGTDSVCNGAGANSYFSGDIDEAGAWSRNLTTTDMLNLWGNYTASQSSSDSCTYGGSGNWTIKLDDNCIISTTNNLGTNQVIINGTGKLTIASGGKIFAKKISFIPTTLTGNNTIAILTGGQLGAII